MIPVLVFDIETIPDVQGLRALNGHDSTSTDADVAAAAFAARREKTGSDFLQHHLHRWRLFLVCFATTKVFVFVR